MKPIVDGWSIVLAGAWNRRIFSPNWLKENKITEQEQIGIAVPINNPTLPIRVDFDDIYMHISDDRLIFSPKECTNDNITKIHSAAKKILETLPHTPLIATGINFQFQEDICPEKMKKTFNINDSFSEAAGDILNLEIKRSFKHSVGVLNFTVSGPIDLSVITIDYNFHKDVEKTEQAISFLTTEDIVKLKDEAIKLYTTAYGDE